MILQQLPWQTPPQAPEQAVEAIEWNGGTMEIPRLGFLTVDELQGIRVVDPTNALYRLVTAASVALSQAAEGRSPRWCYGLLTRLHALDLGAKGTPASEDEQEVEIAHAAIIAPFLEQARALSNRVAIRSVTVILQRVRPDWSDEQTTKLPPGLFNLLHAFEQEEEAAGTPAADPAEQMRLLEEALGKLSEAMASTATDPTGDEPSGNAAASGPAPPSSAASGSVRSLAATSSRRSRKAKQPSADGCTGKS